MGPTLRAHAAHATIGTHTGSSLQPIGYASSEPLYLCDEIHLKSSAGHRTWGRDFAYAEAARGPFPNARSACTCGGPALRCCLLNATETEDPLLIQPMKLPLPRPQRADRNPVVYLAKGEQWRNNRQQFTSEWYLGNDWIAGHRCTCARACLGSPRGATSDPMELQHKSTSEWTNEMYGTLVD